MISDICKQDPIQTDSTDFIQLLIMHFNFCIIPHKLACELKEFAGNRAFIEELNNKLIGATEPNFNVNWRSNAKHKTKI
jgi:hypothetical protein